MRFILDEWQVSGIASFLSGMPPGISYSTTDGADITGGGDGSRVVVLDKAVLPRGERTITRFFDTTVFARPAKGSYGNAPKDVVRGPGVNSWDLSLFKNFPLNDKARFQFRWELYNAFNHAQFQGMDTAARFDPAGNQVKSRFGALTSTGPGRVMQGSLRFFLLSTVPMNHVRFPCSLALCPRLCAPRRGSQAPHSQRHYCFRANVAFPFLPKPKRCHLRGNNDDRILTPDKTK